MTIKLCCCSVGLGLHLESLQRQHPDQLASGPTFIGNNIVHPSAKIGSDCQIGPDVSIGLECEIGNGVRISNSVLLHRVKVSWHTNHFGACNSPPCVF